MAQPRDYGIPAVQRTTSNECLYFSQISGPISSPRRMNSRHPPHDPNLHPDSLSRSNKTSCSPRPIPPRHGSNISYLDSNVSHFRSHEHTSRPCRDIDKFYGNNASATIRDDYDDDDDDDDDDDYDHGNDEISLGAEMRSLQRPQPRVSLAPTATATPEGSRSAAYSRALDPLNTSAVPLMAGYAPKSPSVSPHKPNRVSGTTLSSTPGPMYNSTMYMGGPSYSSIPPPNRLTRAMGMYGDDYDGGIWNPNDIVDDGDEAFHQSKRSSRFGRISSAQSLAARAGVFGGSLNPEDRSEDLSNTDAGSQIGAGSLNVASRTSNRMESKINLSTGQDLEKSEWLRKERGGAKRMKWMIGVIVGILVTAAVVGGIVGGILGSRKSTGKTLEPQHDSSSKGSYDINSSQVKAVLNNKNLHRVFPGMDYTPLNTQYPDCLINPPDQNNITLDVAMLAQLTPAIRLYGTDCGQTEMLLKAIDLLGYNDTVKVWMGVWLGNNKTTNTRQLEQMYGILDKYPTDHFAGLIVGNEVLFRQDLTITELSTQLSSVRSNLTAKGIDLPVATSDLGDNWTSDLAGDTDIVMANIHPFFAGVTPDVASAWSWDFWQTHDVALNGASAGDSKYPKNIISEIGWPSEGGNDCGTTAGCPNATAGAVANVDNMNTFMEYWVCPSMANGTTYFWFEAFDEPWKAIFNTNNDQWETKWGLMDENRNLKTGLKIPNCDGKTIDKPY